MNRQQVKELLPIIQAFAEGKTIQFHCLEGLESNSWRDISEDKNITFSYHPTRYRIKSEYRPFKDAEECFEEMKKHKPFGWIKDKYHQYFNIISICINAATTFQYDEVEYYDYKRLINEYTFADGTPFGVKVME